MKRSKKMSSARKSKKSKSHNDNDVGINICNQLPEDIFRNIFSNWLNVTELHILRNTCKFSHRICHTVGVKDNIPFFIYTKHEDYRIGLADVPEYDPKEYVLEVNTDTETEKMSMFGYYNHLLALFQKHNEETAILAKTKTKSNSYIYYDVSPWIVPKNRNRQMKDHKVSIMTAHFDVNTFWKFTLKDFLDRYYSKKNFVDPGEEKRIMLYIYFSVYKSYDKGEHIQLNMLHIKNPKVTGRVSYKYS